MYQFFAERQFYFINGILKAAANGNSKKGSLEYFLKPRGPINLFVKILNAMAIQKFVFDSGNQTCKPLTAVLGNTHGAKKSVRTVKLMR